MTSQRRRARQMRAALWRCLRLVCGRRRFWRRGRAGREGGQEHSVLEPVVSAAALGFAVEGLAGLAGDRGQAGVGGELAAVGEAGAVAGLGEDPGYPAAQAAVGATLELPGRIIFSGPCY